MNIIMLYSSRAQVAFLIRSGRSIRQNEFPIKDVLFRGLDNIRLHLAGKALKPPKWPGKAFSSINDGSEKSTYFENWSTDRHRIFCVYSEKSRQLFWRRKVHLERENPGYAYEKRAPALRWYAPTEWLIWPCHQRGFVGGPATLYYKSKMAADVYYTRWAS